ncbi:hypothetical protein AOXY_G31648 [Acipenser oxyrinchus oxyrinchus]|uniref:Uncharacterized protein n=1 Tax=Acipenser oxyrinchus oxyrinchus TaxID=40147 RepID=A0AAD8CIM8_ACIOX|nr:hypothetical protein AOXY_G31648 [Acipenser oxyrinchus oxyrinchus]
MTPQPMAGERGGGFVFASVSQYFSLKEREEAGAAELTSACLPGKKQDCQSRAADILLTIPEEMCSEDKTR